MSREISSKSFLRPLLNKFLRTLLLSDNGFSVKARRLNEMFTSIWIYSV